MNRRAAIVFAVVFGGFFLLFLGFLAVAYSAVRGEGTHHIKGLPTGGPRIGVVELKGVIGDERTGIEGRREAEQIRDFAEEEDIKAIVLRIDSPGGAVAPSQEIWEEIKRARTKKKVVCSQGNVAASGAFYISVACDKIVADPGTLTGSIGVISEFVDAQDLVSLAHLQTTTLKTGALKDSGSPLRAFNDQDRAYFTALQDEIYGQFVSAVAEGRHKSVAEIKALADGRVFSGAHAKELGLVDEVGNFRTAIDLAMKLADVEGEPELVYPKKESEFPFLDALRSTASETGASLATGATDALKSRLGLTGGVLLMAPGFSLSP